MGLSASYKTEENYRSDEMRDKIKKVITESGQLKKSNDSLIHKHHYFILFYPKRKGE
jgi:hypothetical protein